jgi:flagellar biosynthetic protein FliP
MRTVFKAALLALIAGSALAGPGPGSDAPLGISLVRNQGGAPGASLSVPMQILLLMSALTVLPAILMALTPFLRITIVLHFLRQALGTQTAPSNQVLIALAMLLSLVIMQPVAGDIYEKGWRPFESGQISPAQAWDQAEGPIKGFLLRFAREKDVALFVELTHSPPPARPSDVSLTVLAPAYILSELKAAFQIGAVLYLPFLIIDLVVASVTLSVGMVQLPPVMISAPFKLLLFVLVDGWNLVIGSLVKSFY